jgi:hypothetical protein
MTVWTVQPLGNGDYLVTAPGKNTFQSDDPIVDLWGARFWSTSSRNRPRKIEAGDVIELEDGDYPRLRLTYGAAYDDPITTIRAKNPGGARISRNPVPGSDTLYDEHDSCYALQGVVIQGDDRASYKTENPSSRRWGGRHPAYWNQSLIGVTVDGEWDARTGVGFDGKWGGHTYEVGQTHGEAEAGFHVEGGGVTGIKREHAWYHHNVHNDSADELAMLYRGHYAKWCGRTAFQLTARNSEGPPGQGHIVLDKFWVEDVCLEDGGGGSAFTLKGNHSGVIVLKDCHVRLGCKEGLHSSVRENITGAFVSQQTSSGGNTPTEEIIVQDPDFEVGTVYQGSGSAARSLMKVGGVDKFTLRGGRLKLDSRIDRPVLEILWHQIQELWLDSTTQVEGYCRFDGTKYNTYTEMLEAIQHLPEVHVF